MEGRIQPKLTLSTTKPPAGRFKHLPRAGASNSAVFPPPSASYKGQLTELLVGDLKATIIYHHTSKRAGNPAI